MSDVTAPRRSETFRSEIGEPQGQLFMNSVMPTGQRRSVAESIVMAAPRTIEQKEQAEYRSRFRAGELDNVG